MDTKEAAAKAIVATHGTQINGYTCKCSWGKETDSSSSSQKQAPPQQNSAYPPAQASCTAFTCCFTVIVSLCMICVLTNTEVCARAVADNPQTAPCGAGAPLFPPCPFTSSSFPRFYFTYFLLLSIPSLSTRIVPLCFQAGGRRRRPNLGLVFFGLCYLYSLV